MCMKRKVLLKVIWNFQRYVCADLSWNLPIKYFVERGDGYFLSFLVEEKLI